MGETRITKGIRRQCTYCGRDLFYPYIIVWREEQKISIGFRFCNVQQMLKFFIGRHIPKWSTAMLRYIAFNILNELWKRRAVPIYIDDFLFGRLRASKKILRKEE